MASLPQEGSAEEQEKRQQEVAHRQTQYEWVTDEPYNPFIKSLPLAETDLPGVARQVAIMQEMGTEVVEAWFTRPAYLLHGLVRKSQPFDEYWEILPSNLTFYGFKRRIPRSYTHWREDAFFAYCRLNGSNPLSIRAYTGPMAKFPITDEIVKGLLPEGETLDSMTKANRLFYCDYSMLDGCPVDRPEREGCLAAPIGLFAVINGALAPLAIQLVQDPTKGPIFTPKDNVGLWTLVKMHFNCADSVVQAWPWHFCTCHMMMESIYVASKRSLSEHHPLYEMIAQHGWLTLALNVPARVFLVGKPLGVAAPLYACGYTGLRKLAKDTRDQYDYRDLNPEVDLARRQVLDPNLLPGYYHRDDTLRVWKIIKQYVHELLDVVYPTEEHLLRDYEVQNWAKELGLVKAVNNPPVTVDPETGVWSFSSKAQFAEFLAIYIHTVSARHAAMNMPLFEFHSYLPSAPMALTIKLPTDKNAVYSDEEIAKGLPGFRDAVRSVLMASLCTPPTPDILLGQYRNGFPKKFPQAKPVVEQLQSNLSELSGAIKARNETLSEWERYGFLDPDIIGCGIDI